MQEMFNLVISLSNVTESCKDGGDDVSPPIRLCGHRGKLSCVQVPEGVCVEFVSVMFLSDWKGWSIF